MDQPLTSFGLDFRDMVVPRLLERRAATEGDREFLAFGDERLSFGEVESAAAALAGGLANLGVGRKTRVALFLPTCADFVSAFFAVGKLGGVTVPINTAYRGYMLEYVLNDTACTVIVAQEEYLDRIRDVLPNLEHLECVIARGTAPAALDLGDLRVVPLASVDGEPRETVPDVRFDDVNCIIY